MTCIYSLSKNRGSHSTLTIKSESDTTSSCSFRYTIRLPTQVFVDIYEISSQGVYNLSVPDSGPCANIELPTTSGNCHQIISLVTDGSHQIEVPVHTRYPIPDGISDEQEVFYLLPYAQRSCDRNGESTKLIALFEVLALMYYK